MGVVVLQSSQPVITVETGSSRTIVVDRTPTITKVTQNVDHVITSNRVLGPPPRGLGALGWRFFQDSTYVDTALYCPAAVRTQIPDNGKGLLMQRAGVNSENWLDPLTGKLYPDAVGDFFFYRLNLTVTPSINNKTLLIDFDIGTPNRIWNRRISLTSGAGVPVPDSFTVPTSSSLAHKTNGGAFYVTPESDVFISKISILATKTFSLDPAS